MILAPRVASAGVRAEPGPVRAHCADSGHPDAPRGLVALPHVERRRASQVRRAAAVVTYRRDDVCTGGMMSGLAG